MLTHYYNKNAEALLSISENACTSLINMLSQQEGKAYIRFKNYKWYLEQRNATEKWLYKSFIEKGGKPVITKPRYFTLGESPYLKTCFGVNVMEINISLNSVDEKDVSFTLDDSMAIQIDNKQKVVYTKKELFHIVKQKAITIDEFVKQKAKENSYIEAQIWNTKYFGK